MRDVVKTDIKRVQNSKRKRRRQRNNSLYYLLVVLLVLGVGITLSMTLLFNISEIEVVGQSQYQIEEVIAATGLSKGDNLVKADVNEVHDNIMATLMYVDEVRVKKKFPDKMIIEVKPSVPTAMLELESGKYLLISETGKILEILDSPNRAVPVIKGYVPETTTEGVIVKSADELSDKALNEVCKQITGLNLYSMIDFDITDVYAISANYENRISIRLGNSSELDYKLRYAMQILTEQLPTTKEGYLIFRANNQYQYVSKEDMRKHIEEIAAASGIALPSETVVQTVTEYENVSDSISGETDSSASANSEEFTE
ncbi:MAG: cell division protein FtsQ/DivIB [Oscillospiraceae bacterium]